MIARTLLAYCCWLFALIFFYGDALSKPQDRPAIASINVAVASNFSNTAAELVDVFEQQTSINTQLRIGSTGKLASQIQFGLDVDVFLAADVKRPKYLIDNGFVPTNEGVVYAHGRLVLWSPVDDLKLNKSALESLSLKRVAIANSRLAPYGTAARQAMVSLGVDASLKDKLVYAESVSQALQFARSENVDLAFIANSQFLALNSGSGWLLPESLHEPIKQQAVQLSTRKFATMFMQFLSSDVAREIISKHGYQVPND